MKTHRLQTELGRYTGHSPRTVLAALLFLAALIAFLAPSAPASAAPAQLWQRCPAGSGAGKCGNNPSIAADPTSGHLFALNRSNARIDEFTAWGEFVKAWGWGVRDGAAELQACGPGAGPPSATCQKGLVGPGAGELNEAKAIAIDPAGHLYLSESKGCTGGEGCENSPHTNRVQQFDQEGHFLRMWGGDVIADGAAGTGTVSPGSASVTSVTTTERAFEVGQPIEGTGIEAGTTIAALGNGTITLSKPAATGTTTALSSPQGANNAPANEQQVVKLGANTTGGSFTLAFKVPNPSPSQATTAAIPATAGAAELQAKLEALSNLGPGKVAVTGSPGGPWSVEFTGARYADTDVERMNPGPGGLTVSSGEKEVTVTSANPEEICTVPAECRGGAQGAGNGQFGGEGGFVGGVVHLDSFRDALAVGPAGQIYVGGQGRLQQFDAEGHYQGQVPLPEPGNVGSIAVDESPASPNFGDLYLAYGSPVAGPAIAKGKAEQPNVYRLNPTTGEVLGTLEVGIPAALALDAGGDVYVFERLYSGTGGGDPLSHQARVLEFDPSGKQIAKLFEAELSTSGAIAGLATNTVTEAGGIDLYLSNAFDSGGLLRAYGPAPFKWPRPVVPPSIDAQYATEATTESATLHARIDPLFWEDTRYYVQYGTGKCSEGDCTQTQPAPPGSLLTAQIADQGFTTPALTLSGLTPATVYHYRFVAQSSGGGPVYGIDPDGEGPAQANEAEGAEAAFRTLPLPAAPDTECPNQALRSGASAHLPDCRAYELITPPQKPTGVDYRNIYPVMLATPSGQMLTYAAANLPSADTASSPSIFQYIASRDPASGWVDRSIDPPRESLSYDFPVGAAGETPFSAFTPDLCHGFYLQDNGLILAPGAAPGWSDLYTRTDQSCGGAPDYSALTTTGPSNLTPAFVSYYVPKVLGFSADAQTVVFTANGALTPEADPDPKTESYNYLPSFQLYAAGAGGAERLVSTLPDASPAPIPHASALGWGREFAKGRVRHAVSADGSRVYWREGNSGALYLRINPTQPPSAFQHGAGIGIGNLSDGSPTVSELFAAKGKAAFSAGSPTVTLLETSVGRFLPGLPVSAPGKIPAGTTILSISGSTLTLSANATASSASFSITSKGPQPFAAGQSIAGPGIAPETTIIAASSGSLTLSKPATASATGAALEAFSDCTEAANACTLPVSGAVSSGEAEFDTASPDGSRAIFRTADKLYEFDATAAIAGEPEPATLIASGVVGFIDASEDASRLYFASTEDLSGGEPEPANPQGDLPLLGQPNLYLYEAGPGGGSFAFIGTLSARDAQDGLFNSNDTYPSPLNPYPERRTSRVSPDGLHAAFSSSASLTGYDNADSASGQADSEAYLYDAAGGGQARLICVSCNPTGARPVGVDLGLGRWSASEVPGWQNGDQPSRALAEDGSYLLFESHDALVPNDTNGRLDVYQWEAPVGEPGDGRCTEASPLYSPANRGCLSLISSGQSGADSRFLDASADGRDVFFFTKASLLDRDPPTGLSDIYDARVNGGFPEPPPPPAACEGEACQSPPEAPNDPTPASSAYQGPGNPEEPPRAKPCPKGKVRRHGRCVAKKHHKRPHRRANPNRRVTR